jgi:hypothetical protein
MSCFIDVLFFFFFDRGVSIASKLTTSSALFAEEKDRDYEAEITKMEKEAMERLEAKTEEMMAKIASTGASK